MYSLSSTVIRGQKKVSLARLTHPSMSMWDERVFSISSFFRALGTTTCWHLKMSSSRTVNSSRMSKKRYTHSGTSALMSGQPLLITVRGVCCTGSSAAAFLSHYQVSSPTDIHGLWSISSSSVESWRAGTSLVFLHVLVMIYGWDQRCTPRFRPSVVYVDDHYRCTG